MAIDVQSAGRRFNHHLPDRCAIDADRILGPNHIVDPIESGVTHGSDKSFRIAKQFPLFAPLIANVDPNAGPRAERNRFEYLHQIGDVFANG